MTIEAGTPGRKTEATASTEDTAEDTVLADAQSAAETTVAPKEQASRRSRTAGSVKVQPLPWWRRALSLMRHPLVRLVFFLAVVVALTMIGRGSIDFVSEGLGYIGSANTTWVIVGIAFIGVSILAMGELMYVLLRSAGVPCKRSSVYALTLTSNSVSATFPGGPAISLAMIFREQHKWGASSVIASWYMVISGVIASGVLALYGLTAFYFLDAKVNPWTLVISLTAVVVVLLVVKWLAAHLSYVERVVVKILRKVNHYRGKPLNTGIDKARESIKTLSSVDLPLPKLALAAVWSAVNWGADCLCLLVCLWAVGAHPNVASVVLAFVTAKIVGTAQVTPGGLGPVEATIVGTLVATGMTSATALAATIIFRMISFILLAAVGWAIFLIQYAGPKRAMMLGRS